MYYAHTWHLDHESIKADDFAENYLCGDTWTAIEPYIPFTRKEAEDFCLDLYNIFSNGLEPYADHPDTDYFAYYGMNAFFVVSAVIMLKTLGYEGKPTDDTAVAQTNGCEKEYPQETRSVTKSSMIPSVMGKATQPCTPERFWADLMGEYIADAKQRGYVDEDIPFMWELIQPGIDFCFALMNSIPYYESNKDDIKQYYYKIARHCFYAGAYYAYLWDKQCTAYMDEDFHLKTLRAGLPATMDPLLPLSREEASKFCLDLYIKYMDRIEPYARHQEYPVFAANGMHAFYMIGMAVQLRVMRVE